MHSSFLLRASLVLLSTCGFLLSPVRTWAAPTIQSVAVQPATLETGQNFTVTVEASADVTQGTVTVDFRPWATRVMRLVLSKQGTVWTATSTVPADLVPPSGSTALVTAIMLDASRASVTSSTTVNVQTPGLGITATFNAGILTVIGNQLNNSITVSRTVPGLLQVNNGAVPILGGTPTVANTTLIQVFALGGNDTVLISETNGPMPRANLFGGEGNDSLTGGSAADLLFGQNGNDTLRGQGGNDLLFGGMGDDLLIGGDGEDQLFGEDDNDELVWNPGDDNNLMEGGAGNDTLTFNGSNISENLALSANGARILFTRDVAAIVLDCDGIERVTIKTLGGADNVTINDLTGTTLGNVVVDLSSSAGPGIGDGAADRVTVNGTALPDVIDLTSSAAGTTVTGLTATVVVAAGEPANDVLVVNGQAGADVIEASAVPANTGPRLNFNGGLGNDIFIGSAGADLFSGGDGDDTILAGDGDDVVTWSPGDDNDTVEGQGGHDTLLFSGANIAEIIDIAANGGRVRFFRNVANVLMDLNDVEEIDYRALGGADSVTVNDLAGTDVTAVKVDFAGGAGGGDGAADTVTLNGTNGDDVIVVSGTAAAGVTVAGLSASLSITNAETGNDRLRINALGGDDVIEASALEAVILLTEDGGTGDDILIGSDGNDTLLGGPGDDVLIGGPGLDVLDGGTGSNVVIQ